MATLIGEAASHLTTRAHRRLLVAGFYLSVAGFAGLSTAAHGSSVRVSAAGVLMLAGFVGYMLLKHLTHHSRTNPPSLLDERGVGVRDRAYHRAYRILTGMAVVALLYSWLAARTGMGWVPRTPREWGALVAVACYLMSALPASVIAWTEPDFPVEDSAEEREGQRRVLRGVALPAAARRIIAGMVVTAALLAGAQFVGVGPFPARYNAPIAGIATGTLFGALLLWNRNRRPQE